MLEIDGRDGGGQVLRSAVALAAVTGTDVRVANVRGNRSEPGCKHQHVAAVDAVARCCDADVEGATVGSETVTFEPGPVRGGRVDVPIPTAGSVTLAFDALLPLAVALPEPLTARVSGGTDVSWSPPAAYHGAVKLPLFARFGVVGTLDVARHGFYPDGGGEATLTLAPASPDRIGLAERGDPRGFRVVSLCSHDLAAADVAERQADAAADRLRARGRQARDVTARRVDAPSAGSAVLVRADYERSLAGFSALGEPGRPAEEVGESAADDAASFAEGPGVVDRHMADQVLPFLAWAGGAVRVPAVTGHVETHLDLLEAFGFDLTCEPRETGALVRSSP